MAIHNYLSYPICVSASLSTTRKPGDLLSPDTYRALSSGISAPRLFDGYDLSIGVLSFSWGDEEERMGML